METMMTKQVKYSRDAEQSLKKLDRNMKIRVISKINLLVTNPAALTNNIKKLRGVTDTYRLRIGQYRVIYTDDLKVIRIVRIAPRNKAYK